MHISVEQNQNFKYFGVWVQTHQRLYPIKSTRPNFPQNELIMNITFNTILLSSPFIFLDGYGTPPLFSAQGTSMDVPRHRIPNAVGNSFAKVSTRRASSSAARSAAATIHSSYDGARPPTAAVVHQIPVAKVKGNPEGTSQKGISTRVHWD